MLATISNMVPKGVPLAILFVGSPCDTVEHELEQNLRQRFDILERDIYFAAVCVPEEKMPFPRIITPCIYYFVNSENLHELQFYRTNPEYTFDDDIALLFRMIDENISYERAYYGDLLPTVEAIDRMFDQETKNPHKYPPLFKQARGLAKVMWQTGKRAVKNLPVIVPSDVAYERHTICGQCEHNDGGRCSACGCNINAKCQLAASECPIKKWAAYKYN